jgi:hypothetical protein
MPAVALCASRGPVRQPWPGTPAVALYARRWPYAPAVALCTRRSRCAPWLYTRREDEHSTRAPRYGPHRAMKENFSLIVMCLCLLASLGFLAQQLTSYH